MTHPTRPPVALVTGASSGIGHASAERLASDGYRVFGTSRRDRPSTAAVTMVAMDVRSDDSVRQGVHQVLEHAGRIDVLVNNAGAVHHGFSEETSRNDARAMMEINFFGSVRVCNAILPEMRRQRHGRIVTIGSLAGRIGGPGEAFYAASKAALARYTEALRNEVWHLGISVSLLEPGAFRTMVLEAGSETEAVIDDYDGPREGARAALRKRLERGGDPVRVAAVVRDIVRAHHPRARYTAGQEARWLPLAQALPQRLVDTLVRRSFGLLPKAPDRRPGDYGDA